MSIAPFLYLAIPVAPSSRDILQLKTSLTPSNGFGQRQRVLHMQVALLVVPTDEEPISLLWNGHTQDRTSLETNHTKA
jgi:hypothetical protein